MITYPLSKEMKIEVVTALNGNMDKLSIPADVRKSALLHVMEDSPALTQDLLVKGWTNGNFKVYSADGLSETTPVKIAAEHYRDNPTMENVLTLHTLIRSNVKQDNMEEIQEIVSAAQTSDANSEAIKQITVEMVKMQDKQKNDLNAPLEAQPENKIYDSSFTDSIDPNEFVEAEKEKQESVKYQQSNAQEEKSKMQQNAFSNNNSDRELPDDYHRVQLERFIQMRSKSRFSKMKKLEEPKWILQQNEDAKELWARLQLSTANTGSFVENIGFGGITGLLTAYGVLGVAPMLIPNAYGVISDTFGFTNMYQPDWVTASPLVGFAMILLGVPQRVMGFLTKTNDNRKQLEMNKIIEKAIEENLIDPQRFMEELRLKGGFKRSFMERFLNKETQEHRIDRYIHNAIKNYNKTARNKVNTDLPPDAERKDNEFNMNTAKEMAEILKNKLKNSADSDEEKNKVKMKNK